MLSRTRGQDCVSDLAFDRWLADGDSAEAEHPEVQAHLAGCTRCALRLEQITRSREAFLRRQPSWQGLHGARVGRPASETSPSRATGGGHGRWAAWVGVAGGVAAAAATASLMLLRAPEHSPGGDAGGTTYPAGDTVRSKGGGASIGAYVQRKGAVERVVGGDAVRPGDRLRFVYSSDGATHFALLHHDGVSASVHYPATPNGAAVTAGRDVPLDFSIRLDATGRQERFFGVFCSAAVALEPLRRSLEQTGGIATPADCRVDVLTLDKRGAGP
jgi:hypothetical protein